MNAMNTVINGSESLHSNAPTLASSAMLGELNISNWVGRKLDKRASERCRRSKPRGDRRCQREQETTRRQ